MKKILFLLCLLLCVASQMIAQDKIVTMYRIGGHYFFKELPMDEAFKISSSIMALADKDGIVRYCKHGANDNNVRSEILQLICGSYFGYHSN